MMTERTTTVRMTATTARMTGKDNEDGKTMTARTTAKMAWTTGEDGEDDRRGQR